MRLFIAFPISPEVKKQLEQTQISLYNRNQGAQVRWTQAHEWHITVVFLGEVNVETHCNASLDEIKNILTNICAKYKPMNFRLEKVDGFSNINNPGVVVVKVVDESGMASQMQKELSDALRQLGIQIDNKPWKPHITIGRNKMQENLSGIDRVGVEPVEWKVDEVILFESELLASGPARHATQGVAGGPRYTKLFYANFRR